MNGSNKLTVDEYADLFSDFYVENESTYGDNMEEAYADFESALNEEVEEEQFQMYCDNTEGIYEDSEAGREEAYADFLAFKEEEYSGDEEEAFEEVEDEEEYSDEDAAFIDFYSETQDIYGDDVEEAYADFIEFTQEEEDEYSLGSVGKSALLGGGLGAVAGAGGSLLRNRKRLNDLRKMGNKRSDSEDAEYRKLKMNILKSGGVGAVMGGTIGAGVSIIDTELRKRKLNRTLKEIGDGIKENRKSNDLPNRRKSNDLPNRRNNQINRLGGTGVTRRMDPMNIPVSMGSGNMPVVKKVTKRKNGQVSRLTKYSAEDFDNDFLDFYSEAETLYDGNVEEAFSEFTELMESEYGISDVESELGKAIMEGQFSDNEEYLSSDEFSDGFAEYYAEMDNVYGDEDSDLEEAYDDYADLVAEQELELMFSAEVEDSEYSFGDTMKGYGKTVENKLTGVSKNRTFRGGAAGLAVGLTGGLIASSVGKDAKERKALKEKSRNGSLTPQEAARYEELKKSRRNKIAGGALAGTALGAGVANKDAIVAGAKDAAAKFPTLSKAFAKGPFKKKETVASNLEDKTEDRNFSAIDLIGKPGQFNLGSTSTSAKEDRNFSGNDSDISSNILSILGK